MAGPGRAPRLRRARHRSPGPVGPPDSGGPAGAGGPVQWGSRGCRARSCSGTGAVGAGPVERGHGTTGEKVQSGCAAALTEAPRARAREPPGKILAGVGRVPRPDLPGGEPIASVDPIGGRGNLFARIPRNPSSNHVSGGRRRGLMESDFLAGRVLAASPARAVRASARSVHGPASPIVRRGVRGLPPRRPQP